jgi:hypothetical protein
VLSFRLHAGCALLFPAIGNIRLKLKLALTGLASGILIRFVLAELDFGAKAIWAFQVGEHFLDLTPLTA